MDQIFTKLFLNMDSFLKQKDNTKQNYHLILLKKTQIPVFTQVLRGTFNWTKKMTWVLSFLQVFNVSW